MTIEMHHMDYRKLRIMQTSAECGQSGRPKELDHSAITQLVDSVPKLADSGSVGTLLHEIA